MEVVSCDVGLTSVLTYAAAMHRKESNNQSISMLLTTELDANLRQERCEAVTDVFDDGITHQAPAVRA